MLRQMKVFVVGCSPAWPNPGGAQSGYLVQGSGRLLLDCGPGVLPRLREQEGWPLVDAIVITHFHLDHWGDLVPWAFGAMYGPGSQVPKPVLFVPPDGKAELANFADKLGVEGMFSAAFEVREYATDEPFEAAGLEVTASRVPHYQLITHALRVSDGDRTLAYSGDSAPSPKLAEVARDADLFLCEATLRESWEGSPDGLRGHLSAEEAIDAFRESGARRLVIIHRPDELPLENGIERAADGDVYDV
jgi:ribonuclease BN (tRNA processing enzyme)